MVDMEEGELAMSDEENQEGQSTVRLDLKGLYEEAVGLVGQEQADRLWAEHNLDSAQKWPGKWAKAWEIVENLRHEAANQ